MQDLSGACLNANKHGMFLVSLAIIKRVFFAQQMVEFVRAIMAKRNAVFSRAKQAFGNLVACI